MKKAKVQNKSYEVLKICFESNIYSLKVNSIVINAIKTVNRKKFIDLNHKEVIVKPLIFDKKLKVPNVYRYSINEKRELMYFTEKSAEFNKSTFNDYNIEEEPELNSIVILLESPHQQEYDYNNFAVKGPAQGKTGELIELEIVEILENIDLPENAEIKIILINPIPYQTSLHYLHGGSLTKSYFKKLRDDIWLTFWENEVIFQKELEETINKIKPLLILNACTKNLKQPINDFFIEKGWQDKIYLTNHPSGWWNEINLKKL